MTTPTVYLVDDDAAVRDALSLLISLKGLRTAVFASAELFLEHCEIKLPGCLLTDVKMAGMSGLELQRQLRERQSLLPVVVLTAYGDVATAREALRDGAVDFLEKPVDDDVLMDVLKSAVHLSRGLWQEQSQDSEVHLRIGRLTARERDVFRLLAEGLSHRSIAERLGISPRTVEVYKSRMMEKLQCRSLAEVIRLGAAHGSLPDPAEPAA